MPAEAVSASTTKLYRDCLRLARHLAGESRKGDKMREMIRVQFRAGASETDEAKIEVLKFAAVRGLSNYMARFFLLFFFFLGVTVSLLARVLNPDGVAILTRLSDGGLCCVVLCCVCAR